MKMEDNTGEIHAISRFQRKAARVLVPLALVSHHNVDHFMHLICQSPDPLQGHVLSLFLPTRCTFLSHLHFTFYNAHLIIFTFY